MDDLKRSRLVLDNAGRDLLSVPTDGGNRRWEWATSDGAVVAEAGSLRSVGGGHYEFTGTALDTKRFSGLVNTEAELVAEIGSALGWHLPETPV